MKERYDDLSNPKFKKYFDEYTEIEKEYLKKFGKNSLDRVLLFDPLHPFIDDYEEAIEILKKAIKENKPLEQISEEVWKTLIF